MKPVVTDWVPQNEITTPLCGKPTHTSTGIIKAVLPNGSKVSVGQIIFQHLLRKEPRRRIEKIYGSF